MIRGTEPFFLAMCAEPDLAAHAKPIADALDALDLEADGSPNAAGLFHCVHWVMCHRQHDVYEKVDMIHNQPERAAGRNAAGDHGMVAPARKKETYGEMGPAMRALPNNRWRAFVEFYLLETYTNNNKDNYGAQAAAARQAGFGTPRTTPRSMAHMAWRLMRDERMISAVAEETRKYVRSIAPEAAKAVQNGVRNPDHKDHARFVAMALDRADPIESRQQIEVTHKVMDPDTEALEELRALRALHTPHAKMLEVFGVNGLDRLLALEAADQTRRATAAKVIEGEVIEGEVLPPIDGGAYNGV
jgi:hypothetical protein